MANKKDWELLSQQIKEANNNPTIKAIQNMEADRKALLDTAEAKWNEPSTIKMMKDYEKIVKSSKQAFDTIKDYELYSEPLITSLATNQFEETKKSLEDIQPHYSQAHLQAQSVIKELENTLNSTSVQSALPKLNGLSSLQDSIKKATENIAVDKSVSEATKSLRDVSKSIVSDSFQKQIEDNRIANIQMKPLDFSDFKIPETPLIALNNKIIEVGHLQNDTLTVIADFMRLQNDAINNQLNELKTQNNAIDNQLEELQKQNQFIEQQIEQKDIEIKANRRTSRNTLVIAIVSILFTGITFYMSYQATYDVYEKETIENNQDNKVLIEAINNKTIQNNQLSSIAQEMKQQNKLLQEQNIYLKSLTKNKEVKYKEK